MKRLPQLAVVGSVNRGKSSLVSTLCEIDSVFIDYNPGSTTHSEAFDMRVEAGGEVIMRLFDTPGFQRARKAREWLRAHAEREGCSEVDSVQAFLDTFRGTAEFEDEWRLLEPIVAGAGVLYVVDGSAPFNPASIAEMEILRMTGRPRMAVINQTSEVDHLAELQEKLSPYFKTTVFNTHRAAVEDRLALLESFRGIDDAWRDRIDRVMAALRLEMKQRRKEVAQAITRMLVQQVTWVERRSAKKKSELAGLREEAQDHFFEAMQRFEARCRREMRHSYRHHRVEIVDDTAPELEFAIREEETWKVFGLRRNQLARLGAVVGGAAGAGIDVMLGGSSLLAGTAIGAAVGAGGAWLSAGKLVQVRVHKVVKLGSRSWDVEVAAPEGVEFPFVLLDRGLSFYQLLRSLAHARRDQQQFEVQPIVARLPEGTQRELARLFRELRRRDPVPEDVRTALRELIQQQL